jgi:hypothetical protein
MTQAAISGSRPRRLWSPPRPKAKLAALQRVLLRHAVPCRESHLVITMFTQAFGECLSRQENLRNEARRFFDSRDFAGWAHLVGLDPDFVREIGQRAGYLLPEAALWRMEEVSPSVRAKTKPRARRSHAGL